MFVYNTTDKKIQNTIAVQYLCTNISSKCAVQMYQVNQIVNILMDTVVCYYFRYTTSYFRMDKQIKIIGQEIYR